MDHVAVKLEQGLGVNEPDAMMKTKQSYDG
jgi:hypothetical protein